jgi:hypothetical protein
MKAIVILLVIFNFGIFGQTVLEEANFPTQRQRDIEPFAENIKNAILVFKAHGIQPRNLQYFRKKADLILQFDLSKIQSNSLFHAISIIETFTEITKLDYTQSKDSYRLELKWTLDEPHLYQNLGLALEGVWELMEETNALNATVGWSENGFLYAVEAKEPKDLKEIVSKKLYQIGFQIDDVHTSTLSDNQSLLKFRCTRTFDPLTKKAVSASSPQEPEMKLTPVSQEYVLLSSEIWSLLEAEIFLDDIYIGPKIEDSVTIGFEFFSLGEGHLFTKAGLKKGDVLVQVNGKKISETEKLLNALSAISTSPYIEIDILRDGQHKRFILFRQAD